MTRRVEISHQFNRHSLWQIHIYDNDYLLHTLPLDPIVGIALSELETFNYDRGTGRWHAP